MLFGLDRRASFIIYVVYGVARGTATLALFVWLAPAPIYFALYRYDLYPALGTFIALFAIRRGAYMEGAIWLGVAAALKGYALFLLPAYCVFIVYQRGLTAAIKVIVLAVAPMILSLLATFAFAGWDGTIAPSSFTLYGRLTASSTYDALNYLVNARITSWVNEAPWIAQSLQTGTALVAAGMRPRHFEDLINSFLFAVLGFMSFSVFYSPQFVLWLLPFVCFSTSRAMLITSILFSWLTYLYFPIGFDLKSRTVPPQGGDHHGQFAPVNHDVSCCKTIDQTVPGGLIHNVAPCRTKVTIRKAPFYRHN